MSKLTDIVKGKADLTAVMGNPNYLGYFSELSGEVASNKIVSWDEFFWESREEIADIKLSVPSDSNFSWCKLQPDSFAFAVAQIANGVYADVGYICVGEEVSDYKYMIWPTDGRIYIVGSASGVVTSNFDPDTGTDSGLTGSLFKYGQSSGAVVNLLSASQPIVQSSTGTTLPSSTPTDYAAGDEIAVGYFAATNITNLIKDEYGNLTLVNPSIDGGLDGGDTGSIYFKCDLPTNVDIVNLYGYAVEGGLSENITSSFTSSDPGEGLTLSIESGKVAGSIDLTKAKAFTFCISEQSGGVNVDNDNDIGISASLAFSQGLSTVDLYDAGSRASDVTYYNTDPSPRTVAITTSLISASGQLVISKNGTDYLDSIIGTSSFNKTLSIEFTVLPGESYSASTTGGVETWFETQGE